MIAPIQDPKKHEKEAAKIPLKIPIACAKA
jgi:hypothetical protein